MGGSGEGQAALPSLRTTPPNSRRRRGERPVKGWAAGRTAAPHSGLGICAGRPGRRSVDRAGWSAIEQAGPIVCTEEAHAMTAPVWGRDRSARLPVHGSRGRRAAKSRSGANGYGWAVNLGPRNRWVRGGGARDEPGHALRPRAHCLAADARATVGRGRDEILDQSRPPGEALRSGRPV